MKSFIINWFYSLVWLFIHLLSFLLKYSWLGIPHIPSIESNIGLIPHETHNEPNIWYFDFYDNL